jgi:hypothetical protein
MRHWTINRQSVILLLGVLTVIVLVLVLPQVDLLDTAFHNGTAPIVIHALVTAKPAFRMLPGLFIVLLSATGVGLQKSENRLLILGTYKIQMLNNCFRC